MYLHLPCYQPENMSTVSLKGFSYFLLILHIRNLNRSMRTHTHICTLLNIHYVPVNLTLAFCKPRHSKALQLSVTGLFWCATILSACNTFLKMKTGVLDCFWGAIFHHFPIKNSFNLTRITRQGERTTLHPQGWVLGVVLVCCWSLTSQHMPEPLRGGTLSWRQRPQSCMSVLSWIKPLLPPNTQPSTSVSWSNLQPWQMWTCRWRDWRSRKGLPDSLLWGQERPSLLHGTL